jgi:hypothetical protein
MSHDTGPSVSHLEPYAKRFIKQVARGTLEISVGQQVITFGVVGILTVLVQIQRGLITQALSWSSLLAALEVFSLTFILIVIFNIIRAPFILDRQQQQYVVDLTVRLVETKQQLTTAQAKEAEARNAPQPIELMPKPNLVLKRECVALTWENKITDDDPKGFPIALVEFKNESEADFPVSSASVRAMINFEEVGGRDRRHISDGAWLDVRATSFMFRLGESKELIIAMQGHEGVRTVGVIKRKIRIHTVIDFEPCPLSGGEYMVEVELVTDPHSTSLGKYRFKLTTRPELQIERL